MMPSGAFAKPVLNTADPLGFFTTVADRLLREYSTAWFQSDPTNYFTTYYGITPTYEVDANGYGVTNVQYFGQIGLTNQIPSFSITNIPVFENGQFVYTPAMQRLLQLSANIYEATTTNSYPTVFRPIFEQDGLGDVFIIGYTNFSNVTGAGDPQLALPYEVTALLNFPANTPITDANGFVNVYGVPWIIGAKKGFPNFNEFSMQDVMKVTRKLQITRPSTNSLPTGTNQLYIFSITNSFGFEYWNSYTNAFNTNSPNNIKIVLNDLLTMRVVLTNGTYVGGAVFQWGTGGNPSIVTNISVWPGKGLIIPFYTNLAFIFDSAFYYGNPSPPYVPKNPGFYYVGNNPTPTFQVTTPNRLQPLPDLLLQVTNHLQAFILDTDTQGNTHVIDYVQFTGPGSSRDLNSEFQNTNTTVNGSDSSPYFTNLVWSTALDNGGVPLGIDTQIGISEGTHGLNTAYWNDPNVRLEIDSFRYFLNPTNTPLYGTPITNSLYATNLAVQVPYSPSAASYEYDTFQANDPLVHYLKSDLAYFGLDPNANVQTGVQPVLANANGLALTLLPNLGKVNARYQPWGIAAQTRQIGVSIATYDQSPYNLSFKDPLMTRSDNWDFPTNSLPTVGWLGRVHRGTPWQTVYLKSSDILSEINPANPALGNVGTNTWSVWTGDLNLFDAANAAPIQDRLLIGLLIPLMDTNLPASLLSVNATAVSDWSTVFGGMVVITNTTPLPQFQPIINGLITIDPASPAVGQIVDSINTTRTQFKNADGLVGIFEHVGDILATPQLTEQSPFLNTNNTPLGGYQLQYGINDETYESIPAQLLPLLRPDSVGKIIQINGVWNIQFSGSEGFEYVLQTSTDLINWNSISTNCPAQGYFTVPISPQANSKEQYFRSVLLP